MPYEIQIPKHLNKYIEQYIDNSYKNFTWNSKELDFLLTVFYRYVQQLGSYKSVEEKVKTKRSCSGCRSVMRQFFVKYLDDLESKKKHEKWQ